MCNVKNLRWTYFSRFIQITIFLVLMLNQAFAEEVKLIDFEIVEIRGRDGHQIYLPISGEPIKNKTVSAMAYLHGPIETANFDLLTTTGELIDSINLNIESPAATSGGLMIYAGEFELPTVPFKVMVSGETSEGAFYDITQDDEEVFYPKSVEIGFLTNLGVLYGRSPISYRITNHGESDEFIIKVADDNGFISNNKEIRVFLTSGETQYFSSYINIPSVVPKGKIVKVTASVSRVSDNTDANIAQTNLVVTFIDTINTAMDIMPGSCENPIALSSKGVIPIVLYGEEQFDVKSILQDTLVLNGIASPTRVTVEDVGSDIDCKESGKTDGYDDLVLKFWKEDLDFSVYPIGSHVIVSLSAKTTSGESIVGQNVMTVVGQY